MKLEKKHWAMLITGVVVLFLVYWFFFRKKKTESSFGSPLLLIGRGEFGESGYSANDINGPTGESGFKQVVRDMPCPPGTYYDNGKCLKNATTTAKFYLPDKNGTVRPCPKGYSSCGYDESKGNCCSRTVDSQS